jgi:predicted PhzF superfamily epimerase YddE/YHI9
MNTPIYQVDAFASRLYTGNPAAVMPLEAFRDDATLQAIAAENNLSETAFLVPHARDYRLRWFTPTVEVPLCGHATLASAAVVMEKLEPGRDRVVFHSASGPLEVRREGSRYVMDFPSRPSVAAGVVPGLSGALGATPTLVRADAGNYLAVMENASVLRGLTPDMAALARLDRSGVAVTARGDGGHDFVSRYFTPARGVPEDPVTGSAHCMLAPYWAEVLGKHTLHAFQASRRGGEVLCRVRGDRVELEGACVFYLEGRVEI